MKYVERKYVILTNITKMVTKTCKISHKMKYVERKCKTFCICEMSQKCVTKTCTNISDHEIC